MNHQPYVRIVPGAGTAILMIHGIIGSPDHFDPFLPLVPADWSIYNILLEGHGKGVDEFAASSMAQWKSQVWSLFGELCAQYDRVAISAHSMGSLFAIQLALERPEKVPFLFLMGVPMAVGLRGYGVVNAFKVALGRVDESNPLEVATRGACSIQTTPKLWKYLGWIPRYLELFREIRQTRAVLPGLTVSCYAFQSQKDELVANRAAKVLEDSGAVHLQVLPNSGHFYYAARDKSRLLDAFTAICEAAG